MFNFLLGLLAGWFLSPWLEHGYRKIKFILYMRKVVKSLEGETRREAMDRADEWRFD